MLLLLLLLLVVVIGYSVSDGGNGGVGCGCCTSSGRPHLNLCQLRLVAGHSPHKSSQLLGIWNGSDDGT